jgi:hypothetical protein
MYVKKNAAAYQVSLSAVKKTHFANSGIDAVKEINPAQTNNLVFLEKIIPK